MEAVYVAKRRLVIVQKAGPGRAPDRYIVQSFGPRARNLHSVPVWGPARPGPPGPIWGLRSCGSLSVDAELFVHCRGDLGQGLLFSDFPHLF
jgi:hypothetical protein